MAEKTINKPKRELKGLKKRPVFLTTVTMNPCSKAIELLAIEYPMKLGVLESCVLPIGQSEAGIRNSNACETRSLGVASPGVCLFFLSRLAAPTSLSGSERRVGEKA